MASAGYDYKLQRWLPWYIRKALKLITFVYRAPQEPQISFPKTYSLLRQSLRPHVHITPAYRRQQAEEKNFFILFELADP